MTKRTYSQAAIDRAKHGALDWLKESPDGYPRSWAQEEKNDWYDDDFEAPPIAGYEALEREGRVVRMETIRDHGNQERIHFRRASGDTGR